MKTAFAALSLIAAFTLGGCMARPADPITPQNLATADFGAPPPANYEKIIARDFKDPFMDNDSPKYEFGTPIKGYTVNSRIGNTRLNYGWIVCGIVTDRRPYVRGYGGGDMNGQRRPFFVMFKDGRIIQRVMGEPQGSKVRRADEVNALVTKTCQGVGH